EEPTADATQRIDPRTHDAHGPHPVGRDACPAVRIGVGPEISHRDGNPPHHQVAAARGRVSPSGFDRPADEGDFVPHGLIGHGFGSWSNQLCFSKYIIAWSRSRVRTCHHGGRPLYNGTSQIEGDET